MSWKLYEILGLNKKASIDDIRKAYKKLAIQYHPDKGGDQEKFKEITNAYKILSDSNEKEKYDNLGDDMYNNTGQNEFTFDNMDIFKHFFGENMFSHEFKTNKICNDYIHSIELTNKMIYFGYEKNLNITIIKKCFKCLETCNLCNGKGNIQNVQTNGFFKQIFMNQCNKCNGNGTISNINKNCKDCNGNNTFKIDKTINIKIPRGVDNGYTIKYEGYGEQPSRQGDTPGNLIIIVNIKNCNNFNRIGLNLIYNLDITFKESIIGKDIIIPHYENNINYNIHEFGIINPKKEYIIKEKGMINEKGKKGDLILTFNIKYPNNKLNYEQVTLINELFTKFNIN